MNVYPNPSNGIFSVELNLPDENHARLSVFNAVGQQVMARELTPSTIGKISLDLSAHAAGVYFLRLEAKGRSIVKRLSLLQNAGQ
jgi:large repetitive protein